MCLIIDACVIPKVFGRKDFDFLPVINWIIDGPGKMIVGGSKYNEELSKLRRYTRFIAELSRMRKIVVIERSLVDATEERIRAIEPNRGFDDSHIVALVEESGCKVVCSDDCRADKYLKDRRFYIKSKRPLIYRSAKHKGLLCRDNIIPICRE